MHWSKIRVRIGSIKATCAESRLRERRRHHRGICVTRAGTAGFSEAQSCTKAASRNKSKAEALAIMGIVKYLLEDDRVNKDLNPKTASDRGPRQQRKQRLAPVPVALPESFGPSMEEILTVFDDLVASTPYLHDNIFNGSIELFPNEAGNFDVPAFDIITGRPPKPSDEFNRCRDRERYFKAEISWNGTYQWASKDVPILTPRGGQITSAVYRERMVAICGGTGSGKTTQVPHFALEDQGQGSRCNIVITPPRRLSAISMARRVATERTKDLSDIAGYKVEFSMQLLALRGGLLFCTVGIFLRYLQHNSKLRGLSDVIVDEDHERDVCTDFLLVLLRESHAVNSTTNVIIMSATINTDKFSEYFDGAPVLKSTGRTHPEAQFFLEDLISEGIVTTEPAEKCHDEPVKMVPDVLTDIMEMKPPCAILSFLPGWNKINKVRQELCKRAPADFHDWILPLRSRIQHQVYYKIFGNPPSEVRKVILTTNIAETSITVNDVVYAVDTRPNRGSSVTTNPQV
ncbi:hypothetical protein HPB50_009018 [Hyalomma asiaticum]|uniref:Uncharacterized protein n=1 Tax=Hyalomma asiaticum TaxID=266040 RepID=A0ACB7TGX5_HYAAI|nr:hypothetical protein HPB50_009018 [Hyalomma asiaticum]